MKFRQKIKLKLFFIFFNLQSQFIGRTTEELSKQDQKELHKNILRTIEKINRIKIYKLNGYLVPDKRKKHYFGHGELLYNSQTKTITNIEKIQNMIGNFEKFSKDRQEPMVLHIHLDKKVKINSKPITVESNDNHTEVICKIKYGLLPNITVKYKIDEFQILKQLISSHLSLQNIDYVVMESTDKKITAIILFNTQKTSSKPVKIENFCIVLLGDKQEKKYHIYNIIGLIFAIDGKTITTTIDNIN